MALEVAVVQLRRLQSGQQHTGGLQRHCSQPLSAFRRLGTANLLDTLADRHMYRLVYRNFGSHDALLFTQATDNVAGTAADLRWWEIRKPGSNAPVVHQNSTYRPNGDFRWMGSAAFDKVGNIGIGYSASSAAMNPAIRIAGRRVTDPRNLLRTEVTVQVGTGSQTGTLSRWGDYSTMQTDPADDCTLWYTTQYIGANGSFNWRTRIVAFKFPNCSLRAPARFCSGRPASRPFHVDSHGGSPCIVLPPTWSLSLALLH